MSKNYTGREIAIFTDAHGLLEPTQSALEDIASRGITEIYSLGDNIGVGPNPSEVLDLLIQYNVQSIAGNSEEYVTLGIEPFSSYFDCRKKASQLWTLSKLTEEQIGYIKLFPRYLELSIGGKKVALCHFANDVRIDFDVRSTWTYQDNFDYYNSGTQLDPNASAQFMYTNSLEQFKEIDMMIKKYGKNHPFVRGYLSAYEEPLFARKRVDFYDAVIQGHVHWKLYDMSQPTKFYSIRAVGIAYRNDSVDTASYVILKEHDEGFDLEEVLVKYDREKMISSILSSDSPDQTIKKFTNIR